MPLYRHNACDASSVGYSVKMEVSSVRKGKEGRWKFE